MINVGMKEVWILFHSYIHNNNFIVEIKALTVWKSSYLERTWLLLLEAGQAGRLGGFILFWDLSEISNICNG